MNKGIVLGIAFIFVVMSFTSISGIKIDKNIIISSSRGNILYVGGSGEGNYTSIQDAIDNASDGDTVFVFDDSSPYYEHIKITKSISLIGENKYTTIIDGERKGHVIHIKINGVTISGFTVQRSGSWGSQYSGICIESDYNLIQGNNVIRNGNGILLDGFTNNIEISNNKIKYNNIESNEVGVTLSETCYNNIVYKNNINNNSFNGVAIDNMGSRPSLNNKISYNNINNNGGAGIWIQDAMYNQISYNNINSNDISFFLMFIINLEIKCNNIIGNENDATFMICILLKWDQNYWDRPRFFPKIIKGIMIKPWPFGDFEEIPWYNFDWRPAKKPYDITTAHGCGIE